MDIHGQRHAQITPDDHGALLSMTTWFLGSALLLGVITRVAVRLTTQLRPSLDDILIVIAAVSLATMFFAMTSIVPTPALTLRRQPWAMGSELKDS